jgi:hypothetical protein
MVFFIKENTTKNNKLRVVYNFTVNNLQKFFFKFIQKNKLNNKLFFFFFFFKLLKVIMGLVERKRLNRIFVTVE